MTHRQLPWFQRACLLTSDIDNALKVYADLLGFTLEYIKVDEPDSFSYEVFNIPRSVQTRFATLSSEQQQRTLALIEVPGMEINGQLTSSSATVIQVNSVEETVKQAEGLGLKTLPSVTVEPTDTMVGRIETAFYDFDNHPVVIYQLLVKNP